MIELVLFTAFLVINSGIYSLLFYNGQQLAANLMKSFAFFYFQIFLIQVILGLTGYLEGKYFLSINFLILILLSAFIYFKRREKVKEIFVKIKLLKSKAKSNIKLGFEEVFILSGIIASIFCIAVVLRASYLFPPRGIDDIGYHIPKIVENVLEKKFVKIPIELSPSFGFPFLGQLLAQSYVLIFHNLKFIDFTNFFFALLSSISVYSISYSIFKNKRGAIISALFVFSIPCVIGQMGSNYVDLNFAAFFISSVALCLAKEFFTAGIMCGFLLGTKYTGFLLLPFLFLIARKNFFKFLLGAAITGSFPYIYNTISFGNPFPGFDIKTTQKVILPPQQQNINNIELMKQQIKIVRAFLKYDNLELSFHKGFSLIFYLVSFPASIFFVLKRKIYLKIYFWAISIPVAYLSWRIIPSIHVDARYLIWFVLLTLPFFPVLYNNRKFLYFSFAVFLANFAFIPWKMIKTEWPILFNEKSNSCTNTISNILDSQKPLWYPNYEEPASFLEFIGEKYKKEKKTELKIDTCNALFYGENLQNRILCKKDDEKEKADIKLSFLVIIGGKVKSELQEEIEGHKKLFAGKDFAVFIREDLYKENQSFFDKALLEYASCRTQRKK
jgi:hypothetical protein